VIDALPPGWLLILGALLVPVPPGAFKRLWMLGLPLASLWQMLQLEHRSSHRLELLDLSLTLVQVDQLALVWGIIFHLALFLALVYALHVRDDLQHGAALVYAGSSIAAVFAGDLMTRLV
jgi:multicomponent Na+:H+ antiporter subunit D